ncbi:ATP-binding protein [Lysobacter sp. S4-A87]|uniref:hybrid sensor histidine kinase/response regulator n=1 Tax=Lysobacter sp. S4-A87 TaxID=2925843 RepID=UPI001F52E21B|nr:hybrid sensor histidine kinase/response regulator [Lysobacter sp. S4-A87]UNK50759.1 ATP-binding protein [Lysobacter sp. S4-A87]
MRTRAIARMVLLLWLASAALWPVHAAVPETPRPRQITVADGLPSNRINGITEDHNGYLWIATSDGLARYDGIGFRIWRAEHGLRDNFVWAVHVDARNRVWIGTSQAGLAMLDTDRKQFRYYNRANTPQIGSDTVWAVTSTPDGSIWFGTSFGGLHRLDGDGKVTRFMPLAGDPRSLPDAEVGQLVVAPDGSLWAGTKGGVARWTGRAFERLPPNALSSPLVNGITAEADGTLWFATPRGVGVRHVDGRVSATPWADAGMKDSILHVLLRDRSGMYWFDIPQGLGRDEHGKLSVVPLYSGTAQGLVRPGWVGAYQDREGGLWFASSSNGLWYLPANWRQFAVMSRRIDDATSLANAHVRGIAPSADGTMWLVGSGGVLDRLDPDSGAITHVARDVGDGYILSHVLEDRSGAVWVSYVGGLARIEAGSHRLRRWSVDDESDPAPAGESKLVETGDGMVWLITEDGVMQVRSPDGRIRETMVPGEAIGLASDVFIEQAGLGPDGALWLAGSAGMSRWNAGRHRFEPIPGAGQGRVHGFATDTRGQVWLARLGELEAYRWAGSTLQREWRMGTDDGLPLVAAGGLSVDAAGIVWMSSVRGLTRVDPQRRAVRVYGVRDGLPSQEFDIAPVASRRDGKILVGSPEGLVLFDPSTVRPNTQAPHLVIESIDARRSDQRISFFPARPFEIRHDDRDLRIVARLLSFNDARNHAYRFRLAGYDNAWVEVGSVGERVFSQLKPGRYDLQVAARTADNVWSRAQTISFTVAAPWWQTWPAIAGFVGLAALLGWWMADAYRRRLKRRHDWQLAQQERELAKQASLAKTQFLATLGHEVRTPMTGVLGMSELLMDTPLDHRQRGYVDSIRRAGRHLLRLVNDALDLARIESGKLELADAPFALHEVVDEAASLMAPLARQRGLAFNADIGTGAPAGLRGDANRVCQILLNLLGNAIKFTEKGSVSLRVSALSPQGVRFEVADTGPGISEEQLVRLFRRFEQAEGVRTAARYGGSGLGLAICQELAEAMGGSIRVESTPGEGARFIVDLPLAEAVAPSAHDAGDALLASRGGPLSLLLVEDDPTVAEVISGLLRAQGHRVTHAAHGLSALAEAATASFDAALLDLDLPGMDGLALAEQLRAQGFSRPLLAITARADADAEPQATAAGFHGFLRKPVTGAMLAGLLEGVPRR